MTELAVAMRATHKPGSGAVKAGGAGAPSGPADALEGAFAAIMDMAAGAATGTVPGAAPGDAAATEGKLTLVTLGADPAANGEIKVLPDFKQADVTVPVEASASGETGTEADPLTGLTAKPRKGNARPAKDETDPTAPALLQAGVQIVVNVTLPAQPQTIEQPIAKKKAGVLAIDAAPTVGSGTKDAPVIPDLVKRTAEETKAPDARVAVDAPVASTPAPAKPAAQANVLAQTDAAAAQADGKQAGSGKSEDERPSPRLVALRASAEAANDEASAPAADPFQDIIQSLPPVLQSQLGVQPVSSPGTEAPAAVSATASTGEILSNHVIDMGVSGQWIDRMAREIAALSEGTGHSRFQLMPPNLGRIQVDLWQGDDKTNIRLLTETDEAARRLREGQGALEASARLSSLSLGTVSVEKSSNSFESPRDQNQNQRQQQQADAGNDAQRQASAQAQGQAGQGRGNTGANPRGAAAVIGIERQAETEQPVRAPRADDPRVRFA